MERFWSKVDKTNSCWLWTASTRRGYGQFVINNKPAPAHRFAYEQLVGDIPKGLQIDHLCRVRNCVNPEHLEPVTCRENILRGEGICAEAARKTHCPHNHPYSGYNLHIDAEGFRHCKECHKLREREKRAKLRTMRLNEVTLN